MNHLQTKTLTILSILALSGCGSSQSLIPRNISTAPSRVYEPDVVLVSETADAATDGSDASVDTNPGFSLSVGQGTSGELITPLTQGTRAPWNGLLFNGPAVARVSVEFTTLQRRMNIERERERETLRATYQQDIDSLRLALRTQQQTDQIILSNRDGEVSRLLGLLQQQERSSRGPHIGEGLIWATGGFLLGTAIFGGVLIYMNTRP